MKTTLRLLGLALVIFLSSCSNDVLIVKRKYNKGFYVNTGGKVKHQDATAVADNNVPEEIAIETPVIPIIGADAVEMPVTASSAGAVVVSKNTSSTGRMNTPVAQKENSSMLSQKEESKQLKIQKKEAKKEAKYAKKLKGGRDGNFILLVILSLFPFFALLAMYLHDGKQITTNFWVDLLLHLTVVGYVIYALLVVFDVVDLA